jgi:hypothetical protein
VTALAPPQTPLARVARDLLYASSDDSVIGHSERSFQFAAMLARTEPNPVDLEVLYIGTILHDVGLAPRFSGPDRFEVRGANAVRTLLAETSMERERVENIWDVIALHASTSIATHKSTETRLANRGISIDVRGAGFESLPMHEIRAVLDAWPRETFPNKFATLLIDEVRTNPGSTRLSWLECIAAKHIDGYQRADFLETLKSSQSFH